MQALMPDDPQKVGEYSLLTRLGEGPRGTTYLARPTGTVETNTETNTETAPATASPAGTAPPAGEAGNTEKPEPAGSAGEAQTSEGTKSTPETRAGGGVGTGGETGPGPRFVVRLLASRPGADDAARTAVLDELSAARRVSGAHAVRVVDAGWHGDRPYVVREYVEGRSLRETVEAGGPLAGDALERVAVGALTALTAVHLAGLTHGALSPSNVILTQDGPRIADFGLPSPAETADDLRAWATTMAYAATGSTGLDLAALPAPLRDVVSACLSPAAASRPTAQGAMLWLLGQDRTQPHGGDRPGTPALAAPDPAVPGTAPASSKAVVPAAEITRPATPAAEGTLPAVPPATVVPAREVPVQVWGAPALPAEGVVPVTAVSPDEGAEPSRAVVRKKIGGRFPVGLAAGLGLVVGLSGLGLWGAQQYSAPTQIGRLAAEGDAGGVPVPTDRGGGTGGTEVGGTSAPRPEVTVPWAASPGPQETGVYPLDIGGDPDIPTSDQRFTPPAVPTTVPDPGPTTPSPAPTVTVTATPTVTPSGEASPTPSLDTPTPTPSLDTPTPTASPGTPTPTPSGAGSPTASGPVTPAPNPSRTRTPAPTVRPTASGTAVPGPTASRTATSPPRVTPDPTYSLPRTRPQGANPYEPQRICDSAGKGTGFYVQRSSSFAGGVTYQLYSAAAGANCVVTLKTGNLGKATPVSATLEVQGQAPLTDKGSYSYYAGPVIAAAKGKCVRFTGTVGTAATSVPYGNCG
ncbi:hypothetical protein GCM10009677_51680 [Sphaerisporangium rubeum]|uniref:Protein kinase domain-containing protein n=1 Tax=Sphaerisporangium rubeum TaxID=321317 RepID=A0A7X0IH21_9ACTN|nr:protein kinase [Sphaerisporangium rubeum]MBB6475042.1 hypothetical protein [Sphaerisporangium rubeum]